MANYNLSYVSENEIAYADPKGNTAAILTGAAMAAGYGKFTVEQVAKSSSKTITVEKNKRYILFTLGTGGTNQTGIFSIVCGASEGYVGNMAVPGTQQTTVSISGFTLTVANGNTGTAVYAYLMELPV